MKSNLERISTSLDQSKSVRALRIQLRSKMRKECSNRCVFIGKIFKEKNYYYRCTNETEKRSTKQKMYIHCTVHNVLTDTSKVFDKICAFPGCGEMVQRNDAVEYCHSHMSQDAKQKRRYRINVSGKKKKECKHCGISEEHITERSNYACRNCYPKHNKCYIKGCEQPGHYYKRNGCCVRHGTLVCLQKNALLSGRLLNIIKILD